MLAVRRGRGIRVGLAAALLGAAWSFVPIRLAWSAPAVRLTELAAGTDRVVPIPFLLSHLGVRWVGSEDARVEVRSGVLPGAFGPWRPVSVAHDLGDPARDEVLSGLLRADGARFVQVRSTGDARQIEVVAIDAVRGPRRLLRARPAAWAAPAGQPPVVSRRGWGADESLRRGSPSFSPVSRMAVHHTVTPNDDPDPASTVRAIYAYHVRSNGWADIGYNFLIDAAGRVYEGRWARDYGAGEAPTGESADGRGVVGAHTSGNNDGSVGVALLGDFTRRAPSPAALDALAQLLAWEADRHGVDPLGTATWSGGRTMSTIVGHRDVGATSCPGDELYARLPAIRQSAADRRGGPPNLVDQLIDAVGDVTGVRPSVLPPPPLPLPPVPLPPLPPLRG